MNGFLDKVCVFSLALMLSLAGCGESGVERGGLDQPCHPDESCDDPLVCEDGMCVCERATCDGLGLEYGEHPDECGGMLDCGGCPDGFCRDHHCFDSWV